VLHSPKRCINGKGVYEGGEKLEIQEKGGSEKGGKVSTKFFMEKGL